MSIRIPKFIMIDTGFWFALLDSSDSYHLKAVNLYPIIEPSTFVLPWPTLYEVLNTRFVANPISIYKFEKIIFRPNSKFIVDKSYKQKAIEETLELAKTGKRNLSLVDSVIRKMLENPNLRIDGFVSYNVKDFLDICTRRRIPILGN